MKAQRLIGFALVALLTFGCRPKPPADASPGGAPLAGEAGASDLTPSEAPGIKLSYPSAWRTAPSEAFVLSLETDDAKSPVAVSLDIPKLPPHIPGLIPLGLVVNGYTDDLKKQFPLVEIEKPVELRVAGAPARRVRATWDAAGGAKRMEEAVLTVKGDRVFIFRGNGRSDDGEYVRAALDAVLASVEWK